MPDANFGTALLVLGIASVSFIGIGMMTAVLPLISPEKGTQLGFMAQGIMLGRLRRLLPGVGAARSGCRRSRRSRRRPYALAGSGAILDGATPATSGATSGRCS
jgi:ABC-2 type transport system permease protein